MPFEHQTEFPELSQAITRSSLLPELEIIASHSGSETTTLQGSDTSDSQVEYNNNNDEIITEAVQQRYHENTSYRFRRLASKTIVSFGPEDPEDPHNWSTVRRLFPHSGSSCC